MCTGFQHDLHIKPQKLHCYFVAVSCLHCQFNMYQTIEITDCEKRSEIRFVTARNVSAVDIHQQISEVQGPNELSRMDGKCP